MLFWYVYIKVVNVMPWLISATFSHKTEDFVGEFVKTQKSNRFNSLILQHDFSVTIL